MENIDKLSDALDNFNGIDNNQQENQKNKKSIMLERSGLIERVDKVFVTQDGKQLLREQY